MDMKFDKYRHRTYLGEHILDLKDLNKQYNI